MAERVPGVNADYPLFSFESEILQLRAELAEAKAELEQERKHRLYHLLATPDAGGEHG